MRFNKIIIIFLVIYIYIIMPGRDVNTSVDPDDEPTSGSNSMMIAFGVGLFVLLMVIGGLYYKKTTDDEEEEAIKVAEKKAKDKQEAAKLAAKNAKDKQAAAELATKNAEAKQAAADLATKNAAAKKAAADLATKNANETQAAAVAAADKLKICKAKMNIFESNGSKIICPTKFNYGTQIRYPDKNDNKYAGGVNDVCWMTTDQADCGWGSCNPTKYKLPDGSTYGAPTYGNPRGLGISDKSRAEAFPEYKNYVYVSSARPYDDKFCGV
jgi:hypothetical protein